MNQSKTQSLDTERKCNADELKKKLAPREITAEKAKTPPTRKMAREKAKLLPSNGKP